MAHRWLVEALGDPQLLEQLTATPGAVRIDLLDWAAALERARVRRHGHLPVAEGNQRVGEELCEAFLAHQVGAVVAQTLPALSMERLVQQLFPLMSERMMPGFEVHTALTPDGATLTLTGPISSPAEVTLGALRVLFGRLAHDVELREATPSRLQFAVRRRA